MLRRFRTLQIRRGERLVSGSCRGSGTICPSGRLTIGQSEDFPIPWDGLGGAPESSGAQGRDI
jgi:hypothetical protein